MSGRGAGPRPSQIGGLADRIALIADEVIDPCSLAQGVPAGLTEMGLLTAITLTPGEGAAHVELRLRLTAPGCMYGVAFERELRARVGELPEVAAIDVVWDDAFDWTPDDMAPSLTARLAARRDAIRAAAHARG
jgi:metal-sulfur cluster biosynthetic enzyme